MSQLAITVSCRFPVELQRLVFEIAARADGETARRLVLVARHVRRWIEPILYECMVVQSQRHATLLLETLRTRQQLNTLTKNTKSLGLGDTVTFRQSKAILAACSHSITNFAVSTSTCNPSIFLPYVRGLHSIRRLSIRAQHASELSFPPALLTSLTHLMILEGPYSWFQMRAAARSTKGLGGSEPVTTPNPNPSSATALFNSLTHFAVCSKNWGSTQSLLKFGENLRYFVVIVPPQFKAITIIAQRIEEMGDRRVVVLEHQHSIGGWTAAASASASASASVSVSSALVSVCDSCEMNVWERAEKLVREGCFAEHGDVKKWS